MAMEPDWLPLWVDDDEFHAGLSEGNQYLFAIKFTTGWVYFSDVLIWDCESPPQWADGGHGFDLQDVSHFASIEPPVVNDSPPVLVESPQ